MSSLSRYYRAMLEDLFCMREGHLLNFSNTTFRDFMLLHANIDVYVELGYKDEPSKAKKFKYFVKHESDTLVGKIILELLKMRNNQVQKLCAVDDEYQDPYGDYAIKIKKVADAMFTGSIMLPSNVERLDAELLSASVVLQDLLCICEKICNNELYNYSRTENEINDYFRDMLNAKGYIQVMDQTRHGISMSGKDAGEVDILLKKDNKEIAIIEGLKLDCVNRNYIKEHIDKAVVNYNALGTATFIIAYVGVVNFQDFWNGTYEYLKNFSYPLEVKRVTKEYAYPNAAVRVANIILSRDGYDFPTYFIAVNIECDKEY